MGTFEMPGHRLDAVQEGAILASLLINQTKMVCAFGGIQIDCPVCPLFPGQIG